MTAESLGKKGKGILPLISTMPKDNHSLLQLYLDGPKNNFFTFFSVSENNSPKINNSNLNSNFSHLKNKNLYKILVSQKKATENVFNKKKFLSGHLMFIIEMKKQWVSFLAFLF